MPTPNDNDDNSEATDNDNSEATDNNNSEATNDDDSEATNDDNSEATDDNSDASDSNSDATDDNMDATDDNSVATANVQRRGGGDDSDRYSPCYESTYFGLQDWSLPVANRSQPQPVETGLVTGKN
ncbi:hypothetical protein EDB86DRAFT_2835614 [Lactarius hatsudake]|nr:hypothetical protein EDB86DRAFT_2835614 [Lactarius hatsudake]